MRMCISYPRHKFVPPCVESIKFLLYQFIQNASVHQCLGQLPDLVPVVLRVTQKDLQALHTKTNPPTTNNSQGKLQQSLCAVVFIAGRPHPPIALSLLVVYQFTISKVYKVVVSGYSWRILH